MMRLCVGVAFALLLLPAVAPGVTYRVPEDTPIIQEAINLASPAQVDTVLLAPGTYLERIRIRKALVLRGREGAAQTTINGLFAGNVITVNGVGRACTIEDLTITGGDANDPDSVGAAIYLNQYASPTIQRCRLVGNRARAGGGINAYVHCQPLVKDCWIADNEGGAVVVELADPEGTTWAEFVNTVIVNNQGFALSAIKGARVWVRNCTMAYNAADGVRSDQFARVRVQNSILTHNAGGGIVRLDNTVCFYLQCNDVYANVQGNYLGSNPQDTCFPGRGSGDVSLDPCYQNAAAGNYHLQSTSPLCSLRQPGACGVLGAYTDPCGGVIGQCVVRIEPATWGEVKRLFR